MSTIYTFKDMRESCQHYNPDDHAVGHQHVPVCEHPENKAKGEAWGYCDENVCPIVRAILDEGEEWE